MTLTITIMTTILTLSPIIVMAILFDQRIMNEPMILPSECRIGGMIVSIEEIKKIKVSVGSVEQLITILESMREFEAESEARNRY